MKREGLTLREFVPLTPAIIAALYPDHRPWQTLKGYALVEHSEEGTAPFLMFALVMHRDHYLAVLRASPEQRARARKAWMARDVVRGARLLLKLIRNTHLPVFARADPEIDGSERLIEYLGFDRYPVEPHLYRYPR